jgi:hypothetical protein
MIENQDYEYIFPEEDKESVYIKLIGTQYDGVVYKFGKVKFEEKDDRVHLLFDYDVIESPTIEITKLEKDLNFKNYIGNFLIELISGNTDQGIIDETRTDYPEEFDQE